MNCQWYCFLFTLTSFVVSAIKKIRSISRNHSAIKKQADFPPAALVWSAAFYQLVGDLLFNKEKESLSDSCRGIEKVVAIRCVLGVQQSSK